MAKDTPLNFRNLVIYQVYLRNHNKTGTFNELIFDLERIKNLGFDVLYLLPIHPVGEVNKKGELGCIYSIKNYREINPQYGTLEDFKKLINEAHKIGLKVMIDIVFNHTAHDSVYITKHPEWYFYRDGKPANKVGDWWDIVDLDFSKDYALWDELIDVLVFYAKLGVDGYRCDVASLVPIDFWLKAREKVKEINEDFIWLAESVHPGFIKYIRDNGFLAQSDCEMYQAFDILYDYDIFDYFTDYLTKKGDLKSYLEAVKRQETTYPANYCKLRFLENHDQKRIASLVSSKEELIMWTAFIFFVKGAVMIYAGQEAINTHQPSLFDIDKVDWSEYKTNNLNELVIKLSSMKKDPIMSTGIFNIVDNNHKDLIIMTYENENKIRYGIFNVGLENIILNIEIEDSEYLNFVNSGKVIVNNHKIVVNNVPLIFDIIK